MSNQSRVLTSKDNFLLDLAANAFTRQQADNLAYAIRHQLGDPTIFCSTVIRMDNLAVYRITTQRTARRQATQLGESIIPALDTATAAREFKL